MDIRKGILILSVICGVSSQISWGGVNELEYSYTDASEAVSAVGNKLAENIDVAIKIDNPALAGMQIKKIAAYTNTVDYLSNTSVWLSSDLLLKNDVNSPDILSQAAPVVPSEFYGEEVGAIEYTFEEPYTLTTDPIYVGYSMTVDKAFDMGTNYPVIISKVSKADSFFLHTSGLLNRWQDSSSSGAAAIVVTLLKEEEEYELGVTSISDAYSADEEDFYTFVTLCNTGENPVNNFTYAYTYDGGTLPVISQYEMEEPMEPDVYNFTTVKLPLESNAGIGEHTVNFTITEANGTQNASLAAESSFTLTTLPFLPVHRPLVEEYTGLWCGYCPRGYIAMEYISGTFGDDQVSICYHNKDAMTVTEVYPMYVGSFPNASVDRQELFDPYYGSTGNQLGILEDVQGAIDETAFASITVDARLEGNEVDVTTEVFFNKDIESSPYLIGYVLTCDGLYHETWGQKNYFRNNSSLKGTPLEPLISWPATVTGLVFNDVAVDVNGMNGVYMSLPKEIKALENYTHEFKYNIKGNDLVQNPTNLRVNAFIVDPNTGKVMNANKCRVTQDAGVDSLSEETGVKSVEYYDLSGMRTSNPAKGIFIRVITLSNGKRITEKVKI